MTLRTSNKREIIGFMISINHFSFQLPGELLLSDSKQQFFTNSKSTNFFLFWNRAAEQIKAIHSKLRCLLSQHYITTFQLRLWIVYRQLKAKRFIYFSFLFRTFGAKCAKCCRNVAPTDWVRRAKDQVFHLACFSCDQCGRQLSTGEQFAMIDEQVLCKSHYYEMDGSTTSSDGER